MNNRFVSVIIPTRDRPGLLQEAIASVYAQTLQDFEIIIVDDGSSSPVALTGYDDRLRLIRQSHQGVSAARNRAMEEARYAYLAFLDDDDLWAPDKLERCMAYLDEHPSIDWLASAFRMVDASGAHLPREPITPPEIVDLHAIGCFTFIHTSSVVVRTQALRDVGGFPENMHISEDYATWARLLARYEGRAIPDVLSFFRQHGYNTRLPFWRVYLNNRRILHGILASGHPSLREVDFYYRNLNRIIEENLRFKRKPVQHALFQVLKRITCL